MVAAAPFDALRDKLFPAGGSPNFVLLGIGAAVVLVILLVLLALVRMLFRKTPAGPAQERGIQFEDLATYSAAPAGGPTIVTIEGVPVRIRLVVVAPIGRQNVIDEAAVPGLLDELVRGLGEVVRQDRARIRVWPAQLSNQGFGPIFHKMVQRPESEGKPSRWVLVAGATPPRPKALLVGLALQADQPNALGRLTLTPQQWAEVLRVQQR